jgi:hypothetical protein
MAARPRTRSGAQCTSENTGRSGAAARASASPAGNRRLRSACRKLAGREPRFRRNDRQSDRRGGNDHQHDLALRDSQRGQAFGFPSCGDLKAPLVRSQWFRSSVRAGPITGSVLRMNRALQINHRLLTHPNNPLPFVSQVEDQQHDDADEQWKNDARER